jgi:2-polyprenyl-6-methoxyphenol hydroxylase-like FAD-dependent oxidoreductase
LKGESAPVLIVGAGPTGLVLALWLTRLGIPVRIIDKNPAPGAESRALAVAARTLEFYDQIGLAESVVAGGVKVPRLNLWVRSEPAAQLPFGRMGEGKTAFPYMLIFPQDAHERLLTDALQRLGVTVERPVELLHFVQDQDGVQATLQHADGTEEQCAARYIAGCDGARSAVRETLGTGFPGALYAELFYVADITASGPAANGELHIELDDADFLAAFPMHGTGRVRLVGSVLKVAGHDPVHVTFDDVRARAEQQLQFSIEKVNWFSTYHVHHRVAAHFRSGRAFLLGDAAHIHSPVGGQGMNTGIGDAVNLAWKLADVLHRRAPETLLDSYEPERIAFARRLVATTDRVFTLATAHGPVARLVRTRIVPIAMPLLFRIARVRRFLFRTVSQIGITYRDVPLNAGAVGGVHGGDRLPWVETGAGKHNFMALRSLCWQVHVYGSPACGVAEICARLGLPLEQFAWSPAMRQAGLAERAFYLVRPDGYVALAGSGDGAALAAYWEAREFRQAAT